jgi:hypothetical protein
MSPCRTLAAGRDEVRGRRSERQTATTPERAPDGDRCDLEPPRPKRLRWILHAEGDDTPDLHDERRERLSPGRLNDEYGTQEPDAAAAQGPARRRPAGGARQARMSLPQG